MIRLGSLFSGYGGLDLGVAGAINGVETVWHCEVDPAASTVLAAASRGVANLGDITTVAWDQVPGVDVLTGGFPCQDLSVAGARAGLAGARSGLWSHMRAAIDALQPGLVVIENVKGILHAPAHAPSTGDLESCPWCVGDTDASPVRALGAVLADLSGLGYDAAWTTVAAADIGAPHRRERVFICAFPAADSGRGRAHRALRSILERVRPAVGAGGAQVAADTDLPGPQGRHPLECAVERSARTGLLDPDTPTRGSAGPVMMLPTPSASLSSCGGSQHPAKRRAGGHAVHLHDAIEHHPAHAYGAAITRWERLTRPAPAPTELAPSRRPRLSPRFVEWMMGLPVGHITSTRLGLSRAQQLRLLGNGVVPAQATHALSLLLPTIDAAHPQAVTAA